MTFRWFQNTNLRAPYTAVVRAAEGDTEGDSPIPGRRWKKKDPTPGPLSGLKALMSRSKNGREVAEDKVRAAEVQVEHESG